MRVVIIAALLVGTLAVCAQGVLVVSLTAHNNNQLRECSSTIVKTIEAYEKNRRAQEALRAAYERELTAKSKLILVLKERLGMPVTDVDRYWTKQQEPHTYEKE